MEILNTLIPLLALVALGAVLRRGRFAPSSFFQEANRLLYWIALPALLFFQTAEAKIEGDAAVRVFLTLLAGMVACVGAGYLVARLLRIPGTATGAFVQGAYRGNMAYVGLPVILLALAAPDGQPAPGINALAVLSLAFLIPIYNLTAVTVLLAGRPAAPGIGQTARKLAAAMATNPLILACLAGLLFVVFKWELPAVVHQICATLGAMSTPLALLGVGASLSFVTLRDRLVPATAAALIKVAGAPLAGYLAGSWIGLSPVELRIALIFLATPTATASYVMAEQLGSDEMLAGAIIVMSTLLSVPALTASLLIR